VSDKQDKETTPEQSTVTFLIPCYNTPLLTSDLLYTALDSKLFVGCQFALLLQASDPRVETYKELVVTIREKGLDVGYFIFDGTPFCGMINRVAPILNTRSVCVLNNQHSPWYTGKDGIGIAGAIDLWLNQAVEPMRVGVFDGQGNYPVVTKHLIERLGYMFHPLCTGREEAERWLLMVAEKLAIIGTIPDCKLIASSADTFDLLGFSTEEEMVWVLQVLTQLTDDEVERIGTYLVK